MGQLTVGEVCAAIDRRYPPGGAESWDQFGLYCGDSSASVSTALLAVDVSDRVIAEAIDVGAELIVTHHPLLLRGIHAVTGSSPKGRRLLAMIRAGINAFNSHTAADAAQSGVSDAVASLVGLTDVRALDARSADPLDTVVTFVPPDHVGPVIDAITSAGAGSLGDYDRCYFSVDGHGSFRSSPQANPFVGEPGSTTSVTESRIEILSPRRRRAQIVEALLAAHPYETPAYHVVERADTAGLTGIGRVGQLLEPVTAEQLARTLAERLPDTVSGIKVGGDPQRLVRRVAILAGAGDSHLDAARSSGADAYITSDLRHHPADEALAWDDAPVLIDVPHWSCEWAWLPVLQQFLKETFNGLRVVISEERTEPWALRV